MGPRVFALSSYHCMLAEAEVRGAGKVLVLTTERDPCRALSRLAEPALEAVGAVVLMEVTADLKLGWVEEASLCSPGPVSKPLIKATRALGSGAAFISLGAESCCLLAKIAQDQLVLQSFPLLVLVQPQLSSMKLGSRSVLSQLQVVLVLSKSAAQTDARRLLLAVFPRASLRICNDGPAPHGINLAEVGMCIGDAVLLSMGCEATSSRYRHEEDAAFNNAATICGTSPASEATHAQDGGDAAQATDTSQKLPEGAGVPQKDMAQGVRTGSAGGGGGGGCVLEEALGERQGQDAGAPVERGQECEGEATIGVSPLLLSCMSLCFDLLCVLRSKHSLTPLCFEIRTQFDSPQAMRSKHSLTPPKPKTKTTEILCSSHLKTSRTHTAWPRVENHIYTPNSKA